jgi:hypothetical protein
MENQIICPHCLKTISYYSTIDSAAKGEKLGSTFSIFGRGKKITYRSIAAQHRIQTRPVTIVEIRFHELALATG